MGNLVAKLEKKLFKVQAGIGDPLEGNFYFNINVYQNASDQYDIRLAIEKNTNWRYSHLFYPWSGNSIGIPTYSIYIDNTRLCNGNAESSSSNNFNLPSSLNMTYNSNNPPKTIAIKIEMATSGNTSNDHPYSVLYRKFPLIPCIGEKTIANLPSGSKLNLDGYKMVLSDSFGYTNVDSTNTRLVIFEKPDNQLTQWDEKRDNFFDTSPVYSRCDDVYENFPYNLKNNILASTVPYQKWELGWTSWSHEERCFTKKQIDTIDVHLFPISPYEYGDATASGVESYGSLSIRGTSEPYCIDYQYIDSNVLNSVITQWTWTRTVYSYGTNWCIKGGGSNDMNRRAKFPDGLPIYFLASLNADLKIGEQDSQGYYTVIINNNPTISDYDHYLGEKNSEFSINYTVWDEDNDKLSVTQRLNYNTIGTYSNVSSGTSSTIYITDDMLKKIPLNQRQYIYIIVDDGKGGQATRTFSFTRTNSAPSISGYDMDMGDKNVGFSINYTVSDADNDTFTITETLNGKTLRRIPNIQGNANETLTISNEQLYNTTLDQKSTIIITADDGKGGISKRTYTFTRTNTPVAIGIIKKTYPTITFRCTDSNPNGYVRLVEIFINNNRVQSFTSGFDRELEYNIDFSYLNEGNNTLMIRATNNQNITSNKNLNVHKKSLKEPEVGTNIITKGKKYQIINKKLDRDNIKLVLNKPLQDDISTTDRVEILNDYCNVFAKTDENCDYEEMQFIKSKELGNGYTQERYQLDIKGRKVTTRVNMYGNTSIKQIKEAFQYLED